VESGRIVERGTHESLYALGGRYYDLYTRQHGLDSNLFLAPGEGDKVPEVEQTRIRGEALPTAASFLRGGTAEGEGVRRPKFEWVGCGPLLEGDSGVRGSFKSQEPECGVSPFKILSRVPRLRTMAGHVFGRTWRLSVILMLVRKYRSRRRSN